MLKLAKQHLYNPIRNRVKRTKEWVYYLGFVLYNKYENYVVPYTPVQDNFTGATTINQGKRGKEKLLFVGSGKSALEYNHHNLVEVNILTINNSIKAFDHPVDYYLCSTNFPSISKPNSSKYGFNVKKKHYFYDVISHAMYYGFGFRPLVGKTIFLDGLYWAMAKGYKEIYLLGFDHDYNKKRVDKWKGKYITDQSRLAELFNEEGEEPDAFYGQNTPDPLRFGEENLENMFKIALAHAEVYGCKIYNLSTRRGGIEVFERKQEIGTREVVPVI